MNATNLKNSLYNEKMVNIKETAKAYVGKEFKNIAEVGKISTNIELLEGKAFKKDADGNVTEEISFEYLYFILEGTEDTEVRVPASVLKQLKAQLEENPNLTFFKVSREGKTKTDTTYTVVPLLK